jgi:hypothetical protein
LASAARQTPEVTVSQTDLNVPPLEEEIRRRAYEIWLERGGQDGSDVVDWLLAEEEVRRREKEISKVAQQKQQIQCAECGKVMKSQEELVEHQKTHQAQGQQSGGRVRGAGGGAGKQSGQ